MRKHYRLQLSSFLVALLLFAPSLQAGINSWTSTGPGGGTVYTIQALPDDVVLASVTCRRSGVCVQGGVFRSADGGQHWIRSDVGLGSDRVIQLAVDPTDEDTLYAVGGTVFKSTDGGLNWRKVNRGLEDIVLNGISLPSGSPGVLYAAADAGIYRSGDSAETWQRLSGIEARAMAVDPGNPQILYAAGDSVYKSTDEGLNWQPLSVLGSELLDVRSILVDPNDSDRVYLVSIAPGQGLFLSQDAGETWDPVDVPVYHETRGSLLTAAPGSPTVLYLTTPSGVMKSTDGAQSWIPFSTDLPFSPASVAVAPDSPDTLYTGTYEAGVFKHGRGPHGAGMPRQIWHT